MGSGKSSFINSTLTALSSSYEEVATFGGSSNHVTKELRCYSLDKSEINIWDSCGIDSSNYTPKVFRNILTGNFQNYESINELSNNNNNNNNNINNNIHKDNNNNSTHFSKENRIHCILFFLPIGILEDENLIQLLKSLITVNEKLSIPMNIIITRADTIQNNHAMIEAKIESIFKISSFLVANYCKSREKDFNIDKKTLFIFSRAISQAEEYISKSRHHCLPFRSSLIVDKLFDSKNNLIIGNNNNIRRLSIPNNNIIDNIEKIEEYFPSVIVINYNNNEIVGRVRNIPFSLSKNELEELLRKELGKMLFIKYNPTPTSSSSSSPSSSLSNSITAREIVISDEVLKWKIHCEISQSVSNRLQSFKRTSTLC